MNLITLSAGIMLYSFTPETSPDTIILNVGTDSRVIFYGKSPQDLKKLEALDLNGILKELNETQGRSETTGKQHLVLDNQEFLRAPLPQSRWQEYLENTFVNFHIGTGYRVGRYTFFQPAPDRLGHPAASLTCDVVMENLMTASLSVLHDMKLAEGRRHAVTLRYGVGLGLNVQRYLHWNLLRNVPREEAPELVDRARALLQAEEIMPRQSDFNAFQSYLQLSPKFSLKNSKGLSTFYFSLGARLNYNRNFENVSPSVYSAVMTVNGDVGGTAISNGPVISGKGYAAYGRKHTVGVSYLAEIGYKWLGLFLLCYPEYVPLRTELFGADRPDSGFVKGKKGNLGYFSFGIRLGR